VRIQAGVIDKGVCPRQYRPPPESESSASKIFRHSGITVAFKTMFEVFTRVGPDNSLERLSGRYTPRYMQSNILAQSETH
jgi:hypothetical protein